jgi:rhodanese-related sulfurtransferase
MKIRLKLAAVFIPLGIIIAAVPDHKTEPLRATTSEILEEVSQGAHNITTDEIAEMIVQQDPSLQLIDVRSQAEFDKFHLPGAVNVPQNSLLSDEWVDVFDQGDKMNVLYSNGNTTSTESYMLLRQMGYGEVYVMHGGLNYWAETIMNPKKPASTSPNDEIALYEFRKGAGAALGGGAAVDASSSSAPAPKAPKRRKKKKRAAGGC